MAAVTLVQQAVYGLPGSSKVFTVAPLGAPSALYGSVSTFVGARTTPGSVMLLVCYSNQFDVTSVVQAGAKWTMVQGGGLYGGDYAVGSLWMGVVGAGGASAASLTITQNGSNLQAAALFAVSGAKGKLVGDGLVVNATSITFTPQAAPALRIVFQFARSGTLVGPTEPNWNTIYSSYNAGFGQLTVAWSVLSNTATIQGRSNNDIMVIAAFI